MTTLVWMVDDTSDWHRVTTNSLDGLQGDVELEHFHSGEAALMAWDAACTANALPDIVLMDFFLGDTYGNKVVSQMRDCEPADHHACIVGFSSVRSGSEAICEAGGDTWLRKYTTDTNRNPELRSWMEDWLSSHR